MRINNTLHFAQLGFNKVNNAAATSEVQPRDRTRKSDDATTTKADKKTSSAHISLNAQTIALFEHAANNKPFLTNNNASLDQPSSQNLTAVNTYQTVNNLAQRESIQLMLGVDIYA
jgi:anti-sigma28 factor (negative regulator of flagellin synthesis)